MIKPISNKEFVQYSYLRLLDLYDVLEVKQHDLDIELEIKALEVICKLHDNELKGVI